MKILFFSPHSAIWEHAFPESHVAEALRVGGHEVLIITCSRDFQPFCTAMTAKRLSFSASEAEKSAVCKICEANRNLLRKKIGLNGYDLSIVLEHSDRQWAADVSHSVSRDSFLDFQVDGVPVGRIAFFEIVLQYKKINSQLTDQEWVHYKVSLKNALLSLRAAQRILAKEEPDSVVNYGSLYAVNHVWREAAEKAGITPYLVQGGASLADVWTRLNLVKDRAESGIPFYADLLQKWELLKNVPADPSAIEAVVRHFVHLFTGGAFTYSPPKTGINIREKFGVPEGKKTLVATMSSYDEVYAADAVGFRQFTDPLLYATQSEWIHALCRFMAGRPDLFLIVRPHPREFGGAGRVAVTESARDFMRALPALPPNVALNLPADQISLYDLAEEASVVLNGWSTVGSEMPLFGIPTVGYTNVGWYPRDLNYIGTTEPEYFRLIDLALKDGWKEERIIQTFRWQAMLFFSGGVDLSASFNLRQQGRKGALKFAFRNPVWLMNEVTERVRKRVSPGHPQVARQRNDLRRRKIEGAWVADVNEFFSKQMNSLLEVRMEDLTSRHDVGAERKLIQNAMARIFYAMTKGSDRETPLRRQLRAFIGS